MVSYSEQYLDKPVMAVDMDESIRGMRLLLHFLLPALAWLLGFVFILTFVLIIVEAYTKFVLDTE